LLQSPLLQGRGNAGYLTREKRVTAASHLQAAEESHPLKEGFFNLATKIAIDFQNSVFQIFLKKLISIK
jgi:hypothetical protein